MALFLDKSARRQVLGHIRPGRGLVGFLARLRRAIAAAIREETAQAAEEAVEDGQRDRLDELPDPPHLEPGEVKYGNGLHDYF